jgi:hypothetical protein
MHKEGHDNTGKRRGSRHWAEHRLQITTFFLQTFTCFMDAFCETTESNEWIMGLEK